ncbi:MAG: AraC family transcriptional regulator [Xenococcaceae cyanobacterium MO_188.B32]|nr:AraC family transcriptional regulator [Xenococcaceae cyanobacterium MO_188.B32]
MYVDNRYQEIAIQRLNNEYNLDHFKPSNNRYLQLIYFENDGQYQHQARTWRVKSGDLLTIPSGKLYPRKFFSQAEGWRVFFATTAINPYYWDADSCLNWFKDPLIIPFIKFSETNIEAQYYNIPLSCRPLWCQCFKALHVELNNKKFGYKQAARAYLTEILVSLARIAKEEKEECLSRERHPILNQVFQYIDNNYKKSISLKDIANEVNFSPTYLASLLRQFVGNTALELIRERRMLEARRLLLNTENDISKVGELIGYKSTTYFIRQFRQVHNQTPHVWRNTHRQDT